MRVLFATGIFPPDIGGPATYVSALADELSGRGVEVEVVTYGTAPESGTSFPVRYVGRNAPLPIRYARYAAAVYRAARLADVVYLQDPLSSGVPGSIGARLARKPVVLKVVGDATWEVAVERGVVPDDFGTYQKTRYSARIEAVRQAQSRVARRAHRVIVPSVFLENVVRGWGVPGSQIQVVPNSLREREKPSIAREKAKAQLGLQNRLVVLSASRLVPWKGFDKLIRVAAKMKADFPELRWIIAGSGPCERDLRRLSTDIGADSVVTFAGGLEREAMSLHLAACDVFVLWSGYEGLSHVLLEAMRAGRAVVASDAGGNPEVIKDGRGGILVPWGNDEELGRTLRELCRDSARREGLEREAQVAVARFAWPVMAQKTLDVLEEVASSSGK